VSPKARHFHVTRAIGNPGDKHTQSSNAISLTEIACHDKPLPSLGAQQLSSSVLGKFSHYGSFSLCLGTYVIFSVSPLIVPQAGLFSGYSHLRRSIVSSLQQLSITLRLRFRLSLSKSDERCPSINLLLTPSVNANSSFSADPLDRWVNGLWFISLALSLSVTLLPVLIKQ
jgi:hypothetical protein